MNQRGTLLLSAARLYAEAGAYADAARCYDVLGWRWTAAESYRQAGDLEHAAQTYRQAGNPELAAHCFRLLGRPELAAQCWEEQGRRLEAAWELLLVGRTGPAGRLLAAMPPAAAQGAYGLRIELARALAARLAGGPPEPLLALLATVEARLPSVGSRVERRTLLLWGVEAADRLERFDWGARLFSAAYRPPAGDGRTGGPDEILLRWQEWADERLGGRAWLPAPAVRE